MPWARLDDQFWSHPKVAAAGHEAVGLHCRALSYSASYATDGFLPVDVVRMLAGARLKPLTGKLIGARLWTAVEGGWMIHDYDDPAYGNPTRQRQQARSAASAKAHDARYSHANRSSIARESDAIGVPCAQRAAASQSQSQGVGSVERSSPVCRPARTTDEILTLVRRLQPTWTTKGITRALADATAASGSPTRAGTALLRTATDPETQAPRRINAMTEAWWWDNLDARSVAADLRIDGLDNSPTRPDPPPVLREVCEHGDPEGTQHCALCRRSAKASA